MIIYKITNKVNNKIYIGQTIRSLKERIYGHKTSIKYKGTNRRICNALVNAFVKYGFENFTFEVVDDTATNLQQLNDLEIYYINKYSCMVPDGYNLLGGGGGCIPSEETRSKMSKNHRTKRGFKVRNIITYILIHPDGREEEIAGLQVACDEYGLTKSVLHKVATGKNSHHKGYRIYKKGGEKLYENVKPRGNHLKGKALPKETREKISKAKLNQNGRPVALLIGDKIVSRYKSVAEAGRLLNIDSSGISKVCRGVKKSHKNLTFKYI